MIAVITALLLQPADPAPAATTETPAPATSEVSVSGSSSNTPPPEHVVVTAQRAQQVHCIYQSDVGTHISHRVCRTQAQEDADRDAARGALQERVNEGISHNGTPNTPEGVQGRH